MNNRLEGKIAVITGGNSGIGRAAAEQFAAEGAKVVIFGRNQKTLDETAAAIGDAAVAVQGDVANLADLDRLFAVVKERFGRVDVLFANAGVFKPASLEAITEENFEQQFSINVKGIVFTVQKALPLLPRGASVVLTSSAVTEIGFPNTVVYSATKGAVRNLARTLSAELLGRGIRVNVVAPGPIETPLFDRSGLTAEQVEAFAEGAETAVAMKRFGKANEVARAALFLASDDSSYMAGAEVMVDGGLTQV